MVEEELGKENFEEIQAGVKNLLESGKTSFDHLKTKLESPEIKQDLKDAE